MIFHNSVVVVARHAKWRLFVRITNLFPNDAALFAAVIFPVFPLLFQKTHPKSARQHLLTFLPAVAALAVVLAGFAAGSVLVTALAGFAVGSVLVAVVPVAAGSAAVVGTSISFGQEPG